jgi:hypothetical protein
MELNIVAYFKRLIKTLAGTVILFYLYKQKSINVTFTKKLFKT